MTRPPRKRRGGPLVALLALAAAIVAALYARCGSGFGFGPGGAGVGRGEGGGALSQPAKVAGRCQLRLAVDGLSLDGKPTEVAAAVAACQRRDGADLVVTGDARQGELDALKAALEQGKVAVFTR